MSGTLPFTDSHIGAPLAARMRPRCLAEFVGQAHLVGPDRPLARAAANDQLHSMILWGPPGTGKTTLARLLAEGSKAQWIALSAVLSGVKDLRQAIAEAEVAQAQGQRTVLFVDEVHRFNKAQQDAFLPHVEAGTITLIGATTENPSFEVIGALLSRVRVYVLKRIDADDLGTLIDRALTDPERGLGQEQLVLEPEARQVLIDVADGDARRALNVLEIATQLADSEGRVSARSTAEAAGERQRRFDKGGDVFYDQISALHKAVRGSSPDAALYWLCRMLDGGCDPVYIARRVTRMASEDIGNADPRGLQLALAAWDAYHRLGSPEGELAIAQAVIYLASVPKSNAVDQAFSAAMADVKANPSHEVPLRLRNAPTRLMKEFGHGENYRYAHNEEGGYAAGERYFPDEMDDRVYYQPLPRGLEQRIRERLAGLRASDRKQRDREQRDSDEQPRDPEQGDGA